MRIIGFTSSLPQAEAIAAFKSRLGPMLVETQTPGGQVLGRAQGEFYVTVQVAPVGRQSRGVIAVTRPAQSYAQSDIAKRDIQASIALLPSGTRVVNRTVSHEPHALTVTLVAVNEASESYNAERAAVLLGAAGLVLERADDRRDGGPVPKILWFRGRGKEGTVAIRPTAGGGCLLVITTVDYEGGSK